MNINWGKHKWTFVIIPDADRSVARLRIQPWALAGSGLLLLALMLTLLLYASLLYIQHAHTQRDNERLHAELSGKSAAYDQTLAGKNDTIVQLENQVVELSHQAEDVKKKMDDMKKLEDDLRSISDLGGGTASLSVAEADSDAEDVATAVGGDYFPATNDDMKQLSEDTRTSFDSLSSQIDQLKQSLTVMKADALQKQEQQRITPSIWPTTVHTITSGFGYRTDPFTGIPSYHSGFDIGAHFNDPVHVTADGTVVSVGKDSTHGNNIVVDHTGGLRTWYMHLNEILVSRGDQVKKGQIIGRVGSTGRSTGPHLHYEVLKNGQSVDPAPYLK